MKNIIKFFVLIVISSQLFSLDKRLNEEDIAQKAFSIVQSEISKELAWSKDNVAHAFSQAKSTIKMAIQEHSLDEEKIIALLGEKLEASKKYYEERIDQRCDYKSLAIAGGCCMLGIAFSYATFLLIDKVNAPFESEFNGYVAQLEPHGIKVREERSGHQHIIRYEGSTTHLGMQLLDMLSPLLVKIRKTQLNKKFSLYDIPLTATSVCAFGSLLASWQIAKQAIWPEYSKHFENYKRLLEMFEKYSEEVKSDKLAPIAQTISPDKSTIITQTIDQRVTLEELKEVHTITTRQEVELTPIIQAFGCNGVLDKTLNETGQTYYKKNEKRLELKIDALFTLLAEDIEQTHRDQVNFFLNHLGWKPLTEISLREKNPEIVEELKVFIVIIDSLASFLKQNLQWVDLDLSAEHEQEAQEAYLYLPSLKHIVTFDEFKIVALFLKKNHNISEKQSLELMKEYFNFLKEITIA